MKWRKYTINTTTDAEDVISSVLDELGVEGVQIEDNVPLGEEETKGMFIDVLPELSPDDGRSKVSFFLRLPSSPSEIETAARDDMDSGNVDPSYTINDRIWSEAEIEDLLAELKAELSDMRAYMDIGEGSIEVSETEDKDWMNDWKQYFKPFTVEDILIKPEWEAVPEAYKDDLSEGRLKLIEIDPGMAFGTGSHETTKLCISALGRYVRGAERVLDLGTGTGILGVAALKEGAGKVVATDLDENCIEAVNRNLKLNDIWPSDFKLVIGNVLDDEELCESLGFESYDLMLANILAPVVVSLAKEGAADRFLKRGGIFITSGIIDTKEDEVVEAFKSNKNWEIVEIERLGEWVNINALRL